MRGLHVVLGDNKTKLYHEVINLASKPKEELKPPVKSPKAEVIAPTIKQIRATKSIARKEKRENTSSANIIEVPRTRKAPVRINL